MLVLLFFALWFILRGDWFYVLPCVNLFLCFSVLLALRLPRLGKEELIFLLFVRLFDLRLFGFVCFLFPLFVWEGLWFVIVAFPGLFSYPFCDVVASSASFFPLVSFFILFLYFSVLLALRLPRLKKRELILVLFVRLFDLRLFSFVCFLFLFESGKGCGL